MPGISAVKTTIPFSRKGFSASAYWATLISATVKVNEPDKVELTFPSAKTLTDADFTLAGYTINAASWTGAVLTLTCTANITNNPVITFIPSGGTATVVNPHFITTWQTENAGSATKTVVIPTYSNGYNCMVNWGDGNDDAYVGGTAGVAGTITHVYATTGVKTVFISGTFPQFFMNNTGDKLKLLTIANWGTGAWRQMQKAFEGCTNMTGTYTDIPDTTAVTDMEKMFSLCFLFNSPVLFDTSSVTTMNRMFVFCKVFNQSVANFDTSKVADMTGMFDECQVFNQPVSTFDFTSVTAMYGMFQYCHAFNQSVANFDTSKVTDLNSLFLYCDVFNQSVANFDTHLVTNMSKMFSVMYEFNQSVANFDTGNVTNMSSMFNAAKFNQSVANFDTSKVTDMSHMFQGSALFNQSLATFDTSAVTDMHQMFREASAFNQDISGFDVDSVTDMTEMFRSSNALSTTNYDALLITWGAQAVQNNVTFHAGDAKYTAGGDAATARAHLVLAVGSGGHGWTITDGGTV